MANAKKRRKRSAESSRKPSNTEREAQKAHGHDGTQTEVEGRNPGIPREILSRNKGLDDKISAEESIVGGQMVELLKER